MAMNAFDTYRLSDGRIVVHEWAMGGESFTVLAPGMWYTLCCERDLRQLTDADDMAQIAIDVAELGARVWPTREAALLAIESTPPTAADP